MLLIHHPLPQGGALDLAAAALTVGGEPALCIVNGRGRGCVLKVDGPVAALWIPLRGRLQLGPGADSLLHPGELRVTEAEAKVHVVGRGNAIWIGVLGTPAAWRRVLSGLLTVSTPEPLLLPARHPADRDLRHRAVALARAQTAAMSDAPIEAILDRVLALQAPLGEAIARCPGRTYAQRRQVFLRLQRVRNYLSSNCHLDLDNDALARMASYSPWHFIRAFRAAYGETPHACLVRQRLERARRMLRASPLAIAEIALASGFENRCAFSRLFRQRFGMTAGAARRMAGSDALRAGGLR